MSMKKRILPQEKNQDKTDRLIVEGIDSKNSQNSKEDFQKH